MAFLSHVSSCGLLLTLLFSVACTPLKQYRTVTVEHRGTDKVDRICEIEGLGDDPTNCALEHRRYDYPDENGQMQTRDYYLAFVEFDDQGWLWDRSQLEMLMRFVNGTSDDFLIFAHAHGWQHNASACDNNVICFQRFLERMDLGERAYAQEAKRKQPRKVLGVYMGWRGMSGTVKGLKATTFWTRKGVANRVGTGGVTEVLTRLNDLRNFRNPDRSSAKTQLIISGHSFGGQVVFKALGQSLIERASYMGNVTTHCERRKPDQAKVLNHCVARSFGDLVVLVNPAFEASAYRALQEAATNRCYPKEQRPSMLVITSTADNATKTAFPLGRSLSSLGAKTQPDLREKESVLKTLGHFEPFRTHDLQVPGGKTVEKPAVFKAGKCGCPYLPPTREFEITAEERGFFKTISRAYDVPEAKEFDRVSYGPEIELVRSKDYTANFPYLMIRTNDDFLPSHSQIYGERFTDFLRAFYFRQLVARQNFPEECFDEPQKSCIPSASTPCQRSWKGSLAKKSN